MQDLRYSIRSLRNSPVFAAVALLSLGLGIGANTAIFSLMDQVLLRTLPVRNPEQLVILHEPGPHFGFVLGNDRFSYPHYTDIREKAEVFSGLLAYYDTPLSMSWRGATERIDGQLVSGNYFEVLGLSPSAGRLLAAADDRTPGAENVAVLSYGYWARRFGRDSSILNQSINLNGTPMTVVGIAPASFHGLEAGRNIDVMVPLMMKAQMTPGWNDLFKRTTFWLTLAGRLKSGVSMRQAETGLNAIARPILAFEATQIPGASAQYLRDYSNKHLALAPGAKGESALREQFSAPLIVLMSMVGLVLLIACANVANLLIARAAARQREIAVRVSLGSGRWRIVRQLLTESLLLALAGGALGLLVASWTGSLLLDLMPLNGAAQPLSIQPDVRVLCFTFGLSLLTGLIFGLIPALQATRPAIADTLKAVASNVSPGGAHVRFRKVLVVAQVALSLLLLIGAGLFARSLINLKDVDLGFKTERLMTFSLDAGLNGYPQQRILELYSRLRDNIAALPGARSVAIAEQQALTGGVSSMTVTVEGYRAKEREDLNPNTNWIGPGYFSTVSIPLIAGREFTPRDVLKSQNVAIVNEKFARYFFGAENAIGRRFGKGPASVAKMNVEIVGVVKDSKFEDVRAGIERFVYYPYTQDDNVTQVTFYVRTNQEPASLGAALRGEVQKLDAAVPVFDMKSMEVQLDESLYTDRMIAILSSFFGLLATLLAALGLYGVMAYMVTRRTREIGIRVALGANRKHVLRLVMLEVIVLTTIGVAIALPVSFGLSRLIRTQLFGIAPGDPLVLAVATITLALIALLSGALPALRATRVDPLTALRYE